MAARRRSPRSPTDRAALKSLRRGGRRMVQSAVALALLPLVWVAAKTLGTMVPAMGSEGVGVWWPYAAGMVVYAVVERVFGRPTMLYVFGHELTHLLAGLLSGARIHSFKVGRSSGEVRLSKSNLFVALSPYIIPIYTVITLLLLAAVRSWIDEPWLVIGFQVLVGASIWFHTSMTVSAMHKGQFDLKVAGFALSGVLILLGNALMFGILAVSLFSTTPTLPQYGRALLRETTRIGFQAHDLAQVGVGWLREAWTWPR